MMQTSLLFEVDYLCKLGKVDRWWLHFSCVCMFSILPTGVYFSSYVSCVQLSKATCATFEEKL